MELSRISLICVRGIEVRLGEGKSWCVLLAMGEGKSIPVLVIAAMGAYQEDVATRKVSVRVL